MVVPMIEVLDFCDTTRSVPRRLVTSTAPQALTLFNGEFVNRQSHHFADRLIREAGDDPGAQIHLAYRLALSRPATPDEVATMAAFLVARGRVEARREAEGPRPDGAGDLQPQRVRLSRLGSRPDDRAERAAIDPIARPAGGRAASFSGRPAAGSPGSP